MNSTDPRVKRTRKLLTDAFGQLLAEKGLNAVTVQDIAERATVNRATFYAHFVDKYTLFDEMIRDLVRDGIQKRVSASTPFNIGSLHLLVVTTFEWLAEFRDHCRRDPDLDPIIETKVQEEIYEFLLQWVKQLRPPQTMTFEMVASFMSWVIFGVGISWTRSDRSVPADEMARQVIALLSSGVGGLLMTPARATA